MDIKNSFKLTSQSDLQADKLKREEENRRNKALKVERERNAREKYEIKEFSGWMYIGPTLGLIVACISGFMIWVSGEGVDTTNLWWVTGIAFVPVMLFGFGSDVEKEWEYSYLIKKDVEREKDIQPDWGNFDSLDYSANGYSYKNGYIYTDSWFSYWIYKLSKIVAVLSTIILSVCVSILLFMWLGTITIAPTTIIIFLLIMIYLKK